MNDPREEKNVPMRTFDVLASFTMTRKVSVLTSDYELVNDLDGHLFVDNSRTDWESAYKEDHYTVSELLGKLEAFATEEIKHIPKGSKRERELRNIINESRRWTCEECYEEA
jgi:hypothetical protein